MKVEIEELELLLGPEDSEVGLRQVSRYARKNKGCQIFEIFSSKVCFVLETIRTSAMCVMHVIVKTEQTQKLRIKFVLYCIT